MSRAKQAPARPMTREAFGPYFRCLADRLGLRDWTVRVLDEPPDNPNVTACVDCRYGRKVANVALSRDFLDNDEPTQRITAAHELIHAHFAACRRVALERLSGDVFDCWEQDFEYGIDAVAEAVAPLLPLPSEVRATA